MKLSAYLLVLAALASSFSFAQTKARPRQKPPVKPAAAAPKAPALPKYGANAEIKADRLRAHLEFIASDLLEGRDTPSRGLDLAAAYMAAQLKLWGVQPGGDNGTYFQRISLSQPKLDASASTITVGGKTLKGGADFQPIAVPADLSGQIEYVGYGYRIPSKNIDPYAGRNVSGKILLVLQGSPKEAPLPDIWSGKIKDAEFPSQAAARLGAKAILVIPQIKDDGSTMVFVSGNQVPWADLKPDAVRAIMAGEPVSGDELLRRAKEQDPKEPFSLSVTKLASMKVVVNSVTLNYQNVVGIVPGSDPALKSEYVAFGAHYDHVGKFGEGPGDHIWNGADDDGSGTVAILEIAHAFAVGPRPKRSLIFVWHAGEEKGLWGSAHFVNNPTVPIDKIVTQLNMDMVGRSRMPGDTKPANANLTDPNSIYVIGSRKLSDQLGDAVVAVNKDLLKLNLDYKYDDPKDPEQFYYRSDHYNYAQKGIPIAFFFDGVHEDYHQAGDEVSKIDFVKMEKVSRTVYAIGWVMANAAERPKVNKPIQ